MGIRGSNCVGAIELCATGCTLMGPADVGVRLGIMDNSQMLRSFTANQSRGSTYRCYNRAPPVPIVVIQVPDYNPK
jgi:hypothetical protein